MIGEKGETLVYVPAGEFTMGSDNGKQMKNLFTQFIWMPSGLTKPK